MIGRQIAHQWQLHTPHVSLNVTICETCQVSRIKYALFFKMGFWLKIIARSYKMECSIYLIDIFHKWIFWSSFVCIQISLTFLVHYGEWVQFEYRQKNTIIAAIYESGLCCVRATLKAKRHSSKFLSQVGPHNMDPQLQS